MDVGSLAISIVGVLLTILLVYYGLKTLRLFRANVAARAWTYVSLSAVFFGLGVVMFVVDDFESIGLVAVGGVLQTVGAMLLVLGLRKNYLFWATKDHFA